MNLQQVLWTHVLRAYATSSSMAILKSQVLWHCRQQELLGLLLEDSAHATAVPRVTRRSTMRILGAMARSAEPVQDSAWNAAALRHLQGIAASLHFYSSPALTQSVCRGEYAS